MLDDYSVNSENMEVDINISEGDRSLEVSNGKFKELNSGPCVYDNASKYMMRSVVA